MPHFVKLREIGVVVIEQGAALLQELHDLQRGRFAQIIHVLLVSHTKHENLGALHALLAFIERIGDSVHHVIGHRSINFARKLDETRREVKFASLPGKIIRVDRDAVATEARAGIEGHVAEGFGRGGVDDFPNVNVHAQAEHF